MNLASAKTRATSARMPSANQKVRPPPTTGYTRPQAMLMSSDPTTCQLNRFGRRLLFGSGCFTGVSASIAPPPAPSRVLEPRHLSADFGDDHAGDVLSARPVPEAAFWDTTVCASPLNLQR